MSEVLRETGCKIRSSDLYERGYGEAGHDFLKPTWAADNIVTNPPYNCAEGFVASGVQRARHKFALLLRLAFLEGASRANNIFSNFSSSAGMGVQRTHHVLSIRSRKKRKRHNRLCVVCMG